MKNTGKYLMFRKPGSNIVSVFKNKSGYRVVLYEITECEYSYYSIVVSKSYHVVCDLISGWPDEEEVEYYLKDIEQDTRKIKDKTTRRYFLRLLRSLPLHQEKTFGDFMYVDGRVNWEKVKEYERQFPGWETKVIP